MDRLGGLFAEGFRCPIHLAIHVLPPCCGSSQRVAQQAGIFRKKLSVIHYYIASGPGGLLKSCNRPCLC